MRGKVLVVEHNATIRSMLESLLKEQGLEVVSFEESDKALDWLGISRADLVLVDNSLPEPGAKAICQEIRKEERLKNIPVIILVSLEEIKQAEQLRQAGASDIVVKPFNPRDLLEKIEVYLLEKAATSKDEPLVPNHKNQTKSQQNLSNIFGAEEALDIDSILSEGKPPAETGSAEEWLRPGEGDLSIEPASAWDTDLGSEFQAERAQHDYNWFLEEMQKEKPGSGSGKAAGKPSSQKAPPAGPKRTKEQFEVEELGTSKLDYQELVEQFKPNEVSREEEKSSSAQTEFNPHIVLEEEDLVSPGQISPTPSTPGSKEQETTRLMTAGGQIDYQQLYADLTEKLAGRLAKELVDRLKPETIIKLLKEELEKIKG